MPSCGIVILAAGASTRMGTPKQSLTFKGLTLLHRAANTAAKSKCEPVIVVLGANAEMLQDELPDQLLQIVINPQWSAGMGTSIRAGVAAMREHAIDALMIFLCDQPLITAGMLDRMIEAHFQSGKSITTAFYAGTFGTPVIFSVSLIEELLALQDGQGGKVIVQRHTDQVHRFPLPQAEADVDTPEDYSRLL